MIAASLFHLDSPANERLLAERCTFEHEVRRYLTSTHEQGYAYQQRFPRMPSIPWVGFPTRTRR
jgi:hypothetical protein